MPLLLYAYFSGKKYGRISRIFLAAPPGANELVLESPHARIHRDCVTHPTRTGAWDCECSCRRLLGLSTAEVHRPCAVSSRPHSTRRRNPACSPHSGSRNAASSVVRFLGASEGRASSRGGFIGLQPPLFRSPPRPRSPRTTVRAKCAQCAHGLPRESHCRRVKTPWAANG